MCEVLVRFGCVSDTWPLGSARTPSAFLGRVEAGIDESFKLTMSLRWGSGYRRECQGYMHMHVYVSTCGCTSVGAASVPSTA
eukprot:scaffold28549_cov64-Phaeocystis_antarctica.AAC.2